MRTSSEILGDLAALGTLRRGQLTEQTYSVKGRDGEAHRQGPYYVLTWSDGGEKRTRRVPAGEAPDVREEIARGKEAQALVREYFRAKEAEADAPSKKKRRGGALGVRARGQGRHRRDPGADREVRHGRARLGGGCAPQGRVADGGAVPRRVLHRGAADAAGRGAPGRATRDEDRDGAAHRRGGALLKGLRPRRRGAVSAGRGHRGRLRLHAANGGPPFAGGGDAPVLRRRGRDGDGGVRRPGDGAQDPQARVRRRGRGSNGRQPARRTRRNTT